MKTILKRISLTLTSMSLLFATAMPMTVAAQSREDICEGIGLTSGTQGCTDPTGAPTVNDTITTVINILSLVIGVVAVIMVIIGGFKYIISSGDSNAINSAKNTVLFALVGLVIVALAQVIVRFVLDKVT